MKKKILIASATLTFMALLFVNTNAGLNSNEPFDITLSFLKTAEANAEDGGGQMQCYSGTIYGSGGSQGTFQLICSGCYYGYLDVSSMSYCGR